MPMMDLATRRSRLISAFLNMGVRISGVAAILRLVANGSVRSSCAITKAFCTMAITL